MKRSLSLILCALIVSSVFTACSTPNDDPANGTTENLATSDTTAPPETEPPTNVDSLPADLSFDGAVIGVLSCLHDARHGYMNVIETDEYTTALDESIYERNRKVEERLDVVITEYADYEIAALFQNLVASNDTTYSIYHTIDRDVFAAGVSGQLLDLAKDVPYVDLSKDYWFKRGNDIMHINGTQFAAFGDMSLGSYDYTHMLAFNQDLIEELNLTSPYEYFENDEWTFDNYGKLLAAGKFDLDGNGYYNEKDRYGLQARTGTAYTILYTAAGLKTVEEDDDGMPYFAAASNQKFFEIYDWCQANYIESGALYIDPDKIWSMTFLTDTPLFYEDRSLFTDMTFFTMAAVRDMKSDFGIVVYPKYDEEQDGYYCWCEGGAMAVGVPVTAENPAAVGATLEALGSESLESVIPVYYETNLKAKYSRDEISGKMCDIIRDSRAFDKGDMIWWEVSRNEIDKVFAEGRPLASAFAEMESVANARIRDDLEKLGVQ